MNAPALSLLKPVSAATKASLVYVEVRELLITGQLRPHDALPLRSLAKAMGTSLMPVRDALRELMAEGGLEILPSKVVRVPSLDRKRFLEITAIRLALEGLAVENAAIRADATAICEMDKAAEAFRAAVRLPSSERVSAMLRANRELHFCVYEAAEMPALLRMIEGLWVRIGPMLRLCLDLKVDSLGSLAAHASHRELISAIRAGSPARARRALCADIEGAARALTRDAQRGSGSGVAGNG